MKKKAPKTVAQQIQNLENKILTNIRDAKNTSLFDFPHVQVILRSSGPDYKPRTHLPCSLSNGQVIVATKLICP